MRDGDALPGGDHGEMRAHHVSLASSIKNEVIRNNRVNANGGPSRGDCSVVSLASAYSLHRASGVGDGLFCCSVTSIKRKLTIVENVASISIDGVR